MSKKDLEELTEEELITTIALLDLFAASDGVVAPAEQKVMAKFAKQIGTERYDELQTKLRDREVDEAGVRTLAEGISRPEARATIYGQVFDLAVQETIDPKESELLAWLEKIWEIRSV